MLSGPDGRAVLVVVTSPGCTVRLLTPFAEGRSAELLVRAAMESPMGGGAPERPKRVLCRDRALLGQLRPLLAEADVEGKLVESLQILDELGRRFADFRPDAAPGITTDLGGWRQTLDALLALAPWTVLDDTVHFTFVGGGLDGSVGILLGNSGEIFGFSLYASLGDLVRFLASAGTQRLPDCTASVLYYEEDDALAPGEVEACQRLGLALATGLCPRVFGLESSDVGPLDEVAQRRLRLAIEGVIAVSTGKLQSIARGDEVSIRIRRAEGVVEVTAARARA